MKQFVLIDPSLQKAGGHELEYARHLLQAAQEAGYTVALATHRGFPRALASGMDWPVLRLLGNALVRDRRSSGRELEVLQSGGGRFVRRCREWLHDQRQREVVRDFQRLFRDLSVEPGSLVFLPMMSGSELAALLRVLQEHPWTRTIAWCVQFQYAPPRSEAIRCPYRHLAAEAFRHRVHCFATTGAIAREYRRLGLEATGVLPYPVDPAFRSPPSRAVVEPLDLVLAGHLRWEKGPHRVRDVVEGLWRDFLENGRLRVWLQGRPGRLRRLLPRAIRPLLQAADPADGSATGPLCCVGHPLSTQAYRDYLLNAQIGLLLHDREIYRDRCSGVLVELLTAGIPVVVPAGTWMADQLAEPSARYHAGSLEGDGRSVPTPPRGAVGVTATDAAQSVDAVADIVQHYAHYRKTALDFAQGWRLRHGPQALLRALEQAVSGHEFGQ